MLADAIRSEAYRLSRNRITVFFGTLFVPLMLIVGGAIFHVVSKAKLGEPTLAAGVPSISDPTPVNLADALGFAANTGANGAVLVFMLIVAATLYAGDYRWETWRLISARNSRINLILGKVAVFVGLSLIGLGIYLVAGLIFTATEAIVFGRPMTFDFDGADAGGLALTWLLSWVRIVQYTMIALLVACVTRSLLASLFVPVVIGFAQSLMGGPGLAILQWPPHDWLPQLLLPGLAYDTLKSLVGGAALPDGTMMKSIASLAVWTIVPLLGAIGWFSRQDLSKE